MSSAKFDMGHLINAYKQDVIKTQVSEKLDRVYECCHGVRLDLEETRTEILSAKKTDVGYVHHFISSFLSALGVFVFMMFVCGMTVHALDRAIESETMVDVILGLMWFGPPILVLIGGFFLGISEKQKVKSAACKLARQWESGPQLTKLREALTDREMRADEIKNRIFACGLQPGLTYNPSAAFIPEDVETLKKKGCHEVLHESIKRFIASSNDVSTIIEDFNLDSILHQADETVRTYIEEDMFIGCDKLKSQYLDFLRNEQEFDFSDIGARRTVNG